MQNPRPTNEDLLKRYKQADAAAFDEFYRRNSRLIYNYIKLKLRVTSDADEAMQEVFFKAHRYILSYDESQPALGWMFGIARNVVFDFLRRRAKFPISDGIDLEQLPSADIDEQAVTDSHAQSIELLLEKLSASEKALLKSKFIDEMTYEELAVQFDTKSETVRQRVSRIMRRIRQSK